MNVIDVRISTEIKKNDRTSFTRITTIFFINDISLKIVFVLVNGFNACSGVSSYNRLAAYNFSAIIEDKC